MQKTSGAKTEQVWISPITKQVPNVADAFDAYHGYWQSDIYDLNENFGTAADLKALSAALHDRDMYLMVDIVVNHFATRDAIGSIDYSVMVPFNTSSDFHQPPCPVDYNNETSITQCWIGYDANPNLPDVNTDLTSVQDTYNEWISSLVSTYSIDGLRLDTVRQVQKPFWPPFLGDLYAVGEVFDGDQDYVCGYQDYVPGLLNYPVWYPLTRAFQATSGSMSDLANQVQLMKSACKDTTLLGSFLENHDNPRFPSLTSDTALDMNAIGFAMLADGVPIVYEGQEQHYSGATDPYDREAIWLSGYDTTSAFYTYIAKVNQVRNHAIYANSSYLDYQAWPIYTDDSTIVMRKGFDSESEVMSVFTNSGSSSGTSTVTISDNVGFDAGSTVTEILGCTNVTVGGDGSLSVSMGAGQPKASLRQRHEQLSS